MNIFSKLLNKIGEAKDYVLGRRDDSEEDEYGYYGDDEDGNTEPSTIGQQIPEAQPETDHRSYQRPGNVPPIKPHQYGPGDPSYLWNTPVPSPLWTVYGDQNSNRDDVADLFGFANSPEELWDTFEQGEYHQISPDPNKKSFWKRWIIVLIVLVVAIAVFSIIMLFVNLGTRKTAPTEVTTAATTAAETTVVATETTAATTPTPTQSPVEAKVEEDLAEAGLPAEAIKTGSEVIFAEDSSTTGDGAININGTRTVEQMLAFLPTQDIDPEAKMSYDFLVSKGKATDEQIFNTGNWATVQIGVDFGLPGNTGSINQKFTELGYRDGKPGDILLVFYNPIEDIFVYFRGACANPQTLRPVPVVTTTPTPTPTTKPTPTTTPAPTPTPTLTPKDPSQDPAVQSNAPVGSGVNQDPGPGAYVAPTDMVTPPAESRINPTPPAATTTAATTAATTTAKPVATPTPTPVDVAAGDPTSVGTPAIPN